MTEERKRKMPGSSAYKRGKGKEDEDTRWLDEETRCPMGLGSLHLAPDSERTPGHRHGPKFLPKAYHPAVQARVARPAPARAGRTLSQDPPRSVPSSTMWCARHAHWSGPKTGSVGLFGPPKPMPILPRLTFNLRAANLRVLHSNLTTRISRTRQQKTKNERQFVI